MKIAIFGAGGVGGYYGGLLAKHGHEVSFIARGDHLEAIRRNGIQVKSIHGDFVIQPARVTDHPSEIGPVDLVLVCTKTYSMESVLPELSQLINPGTTLISLQNGIEAAAQLGATVGLQHVLGGATWLSSEIYSAGVIRQVSQFRRVVIGELAGVITPRARAIAEVFSPTGVTIEISDSISKIIWTKFVFIAAISGIGGLVRLAIGDYRHVPETRSLLSGLMREVELLARHEGINLDPDVVERALEFIDQSAPQIKPSMQKDVENGKLFELDALIGVIGRKAREHNIPTPIADMVHASLLPVYLAVRKNK